MIPDFVVDAVVEVPFGSYPHECHGRYEADFDHFDAYTELLTRDRAGRGACLRRENVLAHQDFGGFLEPRAERLRTAGRRGEELPREPAGHGELVAPHERRDAGRADDHRPQPPARDHRVVFAGVGMPRWPGYWRKRRHAPT